jgi:hypothetical protein
VRGFGEGGDKKYNFNTSDKMCTVSWDVDYFSRSTGVPLGQYILVKSVHCGIK